MPTTDPRVSVIVPVYNALPYLRECLSSLAAQDIGSASFEVIAVDDGSTDGSGEALDDYQRRHDNVRVIHQENSGAPGQPRNVGLRHSAGEYVFFADADDLIGPEALRRLVSFADEHHSDVVIPKMTPLDGRGLPASVYEETVVDADLPTAFKTLFSQKLYRRRMLTDHDVLFAEGRTNLEDGIFNARAYVRAKRISILSDYDFYFLRARDDGGNLSRRDLDPAWYTSAVAEICAIVREHVRDAATADRIVLGLYRRKCLHIYHPGRFERCDEPVRDAWISAHKAFVERFVTEAMERRLESPLRERSYFIRRGDKAGVLAFGEHAAAPLVSAALNHSGWSEEGLEVVIDAAVRGRLELPQQLVCELRRRDGEGGSAFPLVRQHADAPAYGQAARYRGVLPSPSIDALLPAMYDLYLVSLSGQERLTGRVAWGARGAEPAERRGFRIYGTKGGHVAVDTSTIDDGLRTVLRRFAHTLGLRR